MQTVEKREIPLISKQEAVGIFKSINLADLNTAKDLYEVFRTQEPHPSDKVWDFFSVLSFVYAVGKAQGIRNERKRKEV